MLDVGEKLRAARRSQNLSLRELAAKAEVSASLLSQIENGKANPSVRSLYGIAEALSLPVDYFFPPPGDEDKREAELTSNNLPGNLTASEVRLTQSDRLFDQVELAKSDPSSKEPIIRPDTRTTIELEGGVTWSRLTPGPEEKIEFLHIRYDVGAKSGAKMSHHNGREFTLVLEGELLLELGFESYLLKAGDSVIFDSTTPHRLSNAGQIPMCAIAVVFHLK
jgi:transcriptional regulator with XRE-family HTH domain